MRSHMSKASRMKRRDGSGVGSKISTCLLRFRGQGMSGALEKSRDNHVSLWGLTSMLIIGITGFREDF